MKNLVYYFWGTILFCIPTVSIGQIYNMPAGNTVTCSGSFYDPGGSGSNYPDASPTTYTTTFTSQGADQLYITFINIPPTFKNTFLDTNDTLFVYDGPTTSDPLIGKYAGVTSVQQIRSTGTSITFQFITNGDGIVGTGWSASINCITAPDGTYPLGNSATPVTIGCNTRNDFYDPAGYMASYTSTGMTYTTTYTSASGMPMMVNIKDFSTHFRDTLFIYDGNSTSSPLIGAYKGFVLPVSFTTTSDAITFRFKENGDGIFGVGWFITATCIRAETITCGAPMTFQDPAGPSKIYRTSYAGERFVTTYTCPPGQFLAADVTNFITNYPFIRNLEVYDGPNISSPLIGTFSGSGFNSFKVSSSSNSLTFYVNTVSSSFWTFNYDITINCTTTQQANTFTIGGSSSPMPIPCGATSKIFDLGGNTWAPENFNIPSPYLQTYTAPPGQFIKLVFRELNLSDTGDRLNIFDGANTTDPLLASYTSTNNPSNRNPKPPVTITSSSNTITIELRTDQDMALYQGFEAEISCISSREGSNFSLGNSSAPVNVLCGSSSTFEDVFGAMYYTDGATQNYVTTYFEGNGNTKYFAFNSFYLAAGDTLYVYDGTTITDPIIGKYSGTLAPFSVGGSGPITFQFRTNGIDNTFTTGWHATISCNDPLPVEFLNFDAYLNDGKAELLWATANESNNNYYVVEKSENGIDFISIDTIDGAGSFIGQLNYGYTDKNPFDGITYYRIKQVDFDKKASYSIIRAVDLFSAMSFLISTQPSENKVKIEVSNTEGSTIKIALADALGRTLFEKSETVNNHDILDIDLTGLSEGIYFIHITENNHTVVKKIFNSR